MVIIVTDETDNVREIRDFFSMNGLETRTLPVEGFEEGLKDDVNLIVYDTYQLRPADIENIHNSKKASIPVLLITAYPEEERGREEISKLWRGGFIKDYLLRPVSHEMLSGHLTSAKSADTSSQPEGAMR